MEGEDRMWYVAVVSVNPVVSKPAARSIMAVSCRGWATFSWVGKLLARYEERMQGRYSVSWSAWRAWSWVSMSYINPY